MLMILVFFSGEAYFLHHAINNHRELTTDEYLGILTLLENPDYALKQNRNGGQNAILVKQINGKWYECIIGKDKETGKMIIYLTYFGGSTDQKKVAKRDETIEIKIEKPPVFATHASGLTPNESAAVGLSSLGASSNQNVSSDPESVNEEDIRTQRALGGDAVDQGQRKYIRMDDECFKRSVEKDVLLPDYVVEAKLESEDETMVETARQELDDRDKSSLLSSEGQSQIFDYDSAEDYVEAMKDSGSLKAMNEPDADRIYRKAWNYAHVMTPKEAVNSFKQRFNTLPRLLDLKRMLDPRKIRLRHRAVRHTRGCMYRQARAAISFFLILR